MTWPVLPTLLAFICSVQDPTLQKSRATSPREVTMRGDALFNEGKPLEAARLFASALSGLPERAENRDQRNSWAVGAVNAFTAAFELDTKQCATSHAGLVLADAYLKDLIFTYGYPAKEGADYVGMQGLRDKLDDVRAKNGCSELEPAPVSAAGVLPAAPALPERSRRKARHGHGPGLAVGVGVSAALMVGTAIGTGVLYSKLRDKEGVDNLLGGVRNAAINALIDIPPDGIDVCKTGSDDPALATACQAWKSSHQVFLATAVLTGVFAASMAVFTGLLIRQRRQTGSTTALWRRHHAQIGATPHLGGGASLVAGFRF